MPIPTMDFETYSEAGFVMAPPSEKYPLGRWEAPEGAKKPGIAAVGGPAYSEHPSTEVLTLSYDLCDGRGIRRWRPGQPDPLDLFEHVLSGGPIEAHNAMFERLICENVCERKYGWPRFPATVWRCSMATALVAQRPAALAPLAQVLGVAEQKDKEGSRLIAKFCVPQQPKPGLVDKKTGRVKREDQPARRIMPEDEPEEFEKLCAYCDQDVRTEMAAAEAMPPMEPHEILAWQFTQDMNYRGLGVDREGLRACIAILKQVLDQYGRECEQITGLKVTQLEKMKEWLAGYGVHTTSLDADALAGLLDREDLHPTARRVLELRERTGSASVKKTLAIEARCNADDRLRDIIVHHGTRPGRPSGEGPQPLNLPKAGPKLSWCDCGRPAKPSPVCPWCGGIKAPGARTAWQSEMVDHVLEVMSLGSLDMVEQFFGDAMTAIQGCVRGLFTAGPGNMLVSTDYSSLQAVVAACLAGEQWRIDAFTRGDPIYLLGASKITGRSVEEYQEYFRQHGDHHPDRQKIGKVSELACLGGDTLVRVLRNGRAAWQKLRLIDRDTLVWDGEAWVSHKGVIWKGVRPVIVSDGIVSTPDHKFRIGKRWKRRDQITQGDWTNAVHSRSHSRRFSGPHSQQTEQNVYDLLESGPRNRFLVMTHHGPVLAHNCGFQGWINSYRAFGSDETDEVIRAQILAWRAASPAIVEAWGGQHRGPPWRRERAELYGLEGMFIAAVQNAGQSFTYRGISFCMEEPNCLVIRLPQINGIRRALRYHEPMLTRSARNPDELSISYMTWNTNPNYGARGWVRMPTWGGRLFENVVMGVEVDIQRYGANLLAAHGYPMVLGVYDEDVCEVPIGHPLTLGLPPVEGLDPHVHEIEHLLAQMPPEISWWPIKASGGWAGRRYRKG